MDLTINSSPEFKLLGVTKEKIPAIGIGTKGIYDYKMAEEALTYAFNLGLKLVEVSESYGDGLAEELVGRVLRRFKRDEIFIVLRIDSVWFSSIETASRAIARSLQRMGLTYVDIVVVDGLNELIGLTNQVKTLESLIDKGLTRYIGLSNLKLKDLIKAVELLSKHSIDVLQYRYSVINKKVERDILKFAIENSITFLACSPLEKGSVIRNPKLITISSKYNKTPIQTALNYLLSRSTVIPIPKSERKTHIDEIYGALNWKLSSEDIKYLESSIE